MKKISAAVITGGMLVLGGLSFATVLPLTQSANVQAASCTGAQCLRTGANDLDTGGGGDVSKIIKNVVNVLLFIAGAVSVIMLILGGIRYTTSNGNAEQIKSAKNTIMYAIIGLVVAIVAYAVVQFVIDTFAGGSGSGSDSKSEGGSGSGSAPGSGSGSGPIRR